ncbi:MAG: acetolactate decarboxylase [Lentisphaeria bacterium]|nr:acetolactate decarboxylase [Lentisphaeria bacterium]
MIDTKRITFTQISLFSILLVGRYGGVTSVADVKKLGNMAIATMDRLDGEMQMIDGVVYQACSDGHVYLPEDDATIPFGTIANFHAEKSLKICEITSYEAFEEQMATYCPMENIPLAIHFTGAFKRMKVRAVARQDHDGVGLAEAAKNEAVFDLQDTSGDLVGFRLPSYVKGVNAPGWHLHFVDAERRHGGHVVNFSLIEGELRYCHANDFQIRLPDDPAVLSGLNLARDWSSDLKKAEAER